MESTHTTVKNREHNIKMIRHQSVTNRRPSGMGIRKNNIMAKKPAAYNSLSASSITYDLHNASVILLDRLENILCSS